MFNRRDSSSPAEAQGAPKIGAEPASPLIPKPHRPDIPNYQNVKAPPQPGTSGARIEEPEGSKLTVGKDIHLKGEITSCDVLVVEGRVEASMNSRYIHVAEAGTFQGDCEIDLADISGHFDGNLLARRKLLVRSTGRVTGTTRYGEIEIEPGGVIAGNVEWLDPKIPSDKGAGSKPKTEAKTKAEGSQAPAGS